MSFLAGELDDTRYRRKQQLQHFNELIREMHDAYDNKELIPYENTGYMKKVQEMNSILQEQAPHLATTAPAFEPLPSCLPRINSAAPPSPPLPPLPVTAPANLADKLLHVRQSASTPHSPLGPAKIGSSSNLCNRESPHGASSLAPTVSNLFPSTLTRLPKPHPFTAAASSVTFAPHSNSTLALAPSPFTSTSYAYPNNTTSQHSNQLPTPSIFSIPFLPPCTATSHNTPCSLQPLSTETASSSHDNNLNHFPSQAYSAPLLAHPLASCHSSSAGSLALDQTATDGPEVSRAPVKSLCDNGRAGSLQQPEGPARYRKRGSSQGGMRYEFGKDYVPGQLPEVDSSQSIPNLPAKSGIGFVLRPARVGASSCVPPPHPEPLQPPSTSLVAAMVMHDQLREMQPDTVINRVVYDCVLPPFSIPATSQDVFAKPSSSETVSDGSSFGVPGLPGVLAGDTSIDMSPSEAAAKIYDVLHTPTPPSPPPLLTEHSNNHALDAAHAQQYNYFPDLPCWYSVTGPEDKTLVFESRFEGGNLRRAIQVYPYEYDLVLRPDVNTKRHTQWYYFAISNTRKGQRYKFNIINLMKEDSLYSAGMLPLIHSEAAAKATKQQNQDRHHYQQQQQQQQQRQGHNPSIPVAAPCSAVGPYSQQVSDIGGSRPSSERSLDSHSSSRRSHHSARSLLGSQAAPSGQQRPGLEAGGQQQQQQQQQQLGEHCGIAMPLGQLEHLTHLQQDSNEQQQQHEEQHQHQPGRDKRRHKKGGKTLQDAECEDGYLGWHRGGEQVCYYRNPIKRKGRGGGKKYFTLSFVYTAQHDNDLIHFAHCFPFTFTDLQAYLNALECHPQRSPFVHRSLLTTTLAGNAVDCLTITSPSSSPDVQRKKKGAFITARVHPGESNSSWMVRGLIEYLTGTSAEARALRKQFVFKIVPMLNPDGVIVGNYRCNLAGFDLNRTWADASRKLHPTIYACKNLLKQFMEERQVVLFSDFHGHSRKSNIFSYGCGKKPNGGKDWSPLWPGYPVPGSVGGLQDIPVRFQGRLFPLLMQHSAPDLFSYQHCTVKVQRSKAGTSRVVVFREMGLTNSFTLEASIAGASMGRQAGQHFTTKDLEFMGAALASALADYWDLMAYGIAELITELNMLHAMSGDLEQQPDGNDSTDSDDDPSSDDGTEALVESRSQQKLVKNGGRRGTKDIQLRKVSQEYAERAAAGLMDVLNSCTFQQPQTLQELQQRMQQRERDRLASSPLPNGPAPTQVLVSPADPLQPILADYLQEDPPLPQYQQLSPATSQAELSNNGRTQPVNPGRSSMLPAQATTMGTTTQQQLIFQQQQQQQQAADRARLDREIEYCRSMEHLRARGIYRGDTLSWANAPGRLSTTNVGLNVQAAKQDREAERQQESLNGWDTLLDGAAEVHASAGSATRLMR